jgi:UDP-N-acetylmuramyl pentapeptide phosphotransferase/UDP-N-acetylglucosamine-1-phosphate transferase
MPMSEGLTTVFAVTACGAVVAGLEAMAIPLLRRAAIVDVPGHRSSHAVPTPRGGGIPVAAGLLVATGLIGGLDATFFAAAVAGFGMLGMARTCAASPSGGGWPGRPVAA